MYLMEDVATQLRKGSLELAVLALLDAAPRYGVEIVEDLGLRPGLEAAAGTIYPLLTRLKNSGPVGPPRKYYSLTHTGRDQLSVQRDAWIKLSTAIAKLLKEVER